ncbi:MAG: ADP-glyceromanno-heptose 6-epimerase [Bacteroidetes bacterium]|nr:MAG: ADP-glyceromanno-heptose 6-epimerase [Bacteroidota bacterium]
MIVVTGAAGFIGSCMVSLLLKQGYTDIIAVDNFDNPIKERNLDGKEVSQKVNRNEFFEWLDQNHQTVIFIFHLGARTDTTEFDAEIFEELNVKYSKKIWQACVKYDIPLVYASSASTYGAGELGYKDDEKQIPKLAPLNPYGQSKQIFDLWVLEQSQKPPYWAGLKFFNVYGPNEYHKSRMASVIFHSFKQIKANGYVNLFKSHHEKYEDGNQLRDFVYVKDVIDICLFLMENQEKGGIFNLGTGKARTFLDLAKATFDALSIKPDIRFIDMPADIREKYQYFTEANMSKLKAAGYTRPFCTLEDGVEDYVQYYLEKEAYY